MSRWLVYKMHAVCFAGVQEGGPDQQLIKKLYEELMDIDPMRKGYYIDALEGKANVVTRPV